MRLDGVGGADGKRLAAALLVVVGCDLLEFDDGISLRAQELAGTLGVVSLALVAFLVEKGPFGPHVPLVVVRGAGGLKIDTALVHRPVAVVVHEVAVDLHGTGVDAGIVVITVVAAGGFGRVSVSVHVGQIGAATVLVDAVVGNFGGPRVYRAVVVVAVAFAGGDPVGIAVVTLDRGLAQVQGVDAGIMFARIPVAPGALRYTDASHVEGRIDHVGVVPRRVFPSVENALGVRRTRMGVDVFPPAAVKTLGIDAVTRRASIQGIVCEVVLGQHIVGVPLGRRVQSGIEGQGRPSQRASLCIDELQKFLADTCPGRSRQDQGRQHQRHGSDLPFFHGVSRVLQTAGGRRVPFFVIQREIIECRKCGFRQCAVRSSATRAMDCAAQAHFRRMPDCVLPFDRCNIRASGRRLHPAGEQKGGIALKRSEVI